jgi:hypothetical protein
LYCIVITTTALILPGVAPPVTDVTEACMAIVAVLSAAIFCVMLEPVPFSVPVAASHGYRHVGRRTAVPVVIRTGSRIGIAGEGDRDAAGPRRALGKKQVKVHRIG